MRPRRLPLLPLGLALHLWAAPTWGEGDPGWFEARIANLQRQIRLASGAPLTGRAGWMSCGYVAPALTAESPADGDGAFDRMLRELQFFLRQRDE